jgi:hypothetical protein
MYISTLINVCKTFYTYRYRLRVVRVMRVVWLIRVTQRRRTRKTLCMDK